MAKTATASSTARKSEFNTQAAKLIVTALLVILSIVALVVPSWGVSLGSFLGGCNQVTINLSAPDGSELSDDERTAAEAVLTERAKSLYELGVSCGHDENGTFMVTVPLAYDAASVAESLTGTGHVDFVSQLDISDADELEKLQNGSDDISLSSGSYTAFMTNANVTSAKVVESSYSGTTTYAVQVSMDADAQSAFATKTEELASSYGVIAVVVDGTVVATPYVSEKIDSSEVSISGGFSRAEAYALAAKFNSGELGATATVGTLTTFGSAFGGFGLALAIVGALALAAAAGFACVHFFGIGGWAACASVLATLVVCLGVAALLTTFDILVLGRSALLGLLAVAACDIVATVLACRQYSLERSGGASVRKSQELASTALVTVERIYAFAGVIWIIAALFFDRHIGQLLWVLGCGLLVEFVLAFIFKLPMLCILTASDKVVATEATSSEPASDEASLDEAPSGTVESK